jgi:hypothetical protein
MKFKEARSEAEENEAQGLGSAEGIMTALRQNQKGISITGGSIMCNFVQFLCQ